MKLRDSIHISVSLRKQANEYESIVHDYQMRKNYCSYIKYCQNWHKQIQLIVILKHFFSPIRVLHKWTIYNSLY